jgi:hypothetical protein
MRAVFVTAPILAQPNAQLGRLRQYDNDSIVVYTPRFIRVKAAYETAVGAIAVSRAAFLL